MNRRRKVAVAVAVLVAATVQAVSVSVAAARQPDGTQVQTIELVAVDGGRVVIDHRPYTGRVLFRVDAGAVTVTETVPVDAYLSGIAEMPFSWPLEALKAQAVAARTYLARRLLGGRSGDAAVHGYDICATSRCQVYRGVELVEGPSGERWSEAVLSTSGEVLLYEDRPIEAVYTSMVGSRSRANQDVWASDPLPYLQPVDSPEVGIAPFATWRVEVTARQFVEILRADGLDVSGELTAIEVDDPPEGMGRTTITVRTDGGTDSVLAPALKGVFNRWGDRLYPGMLPMRSGDGPDLPDPLPSYTYEIRLERSEEPPVAAWMPVDDRSGEDVVVFEGEGWGHGVGMSQWGARIMADDGATYDAILGHYYSGIVPEAAPTLVPAEVVVGLVTHVASVHVEVQGPVTVRVNGVPAGTVREGVWFVRDTARGLDLFAEDGVAVSPISGRMWPR